MNFLLALVLAVAGANLKIAVTSTGPNPDSNIQAQFGRATWFMIYDPGTRNWQSVDNSAAARARGGAGRQAAEELARRGVKTVITGQCGPNALQALSSAGIRIFQASGGTVAGAVRDYEAGKLRELK